jgi:crotonobetainyl-CoA:carnitine CoA-transferase CaiB-like acyl-CoA transferase
MTSAQLALEASDGYVVLAGAIGEDKWDALWHRVGRPELADDPRYLGRDVEGPFYLDVIRPTLETWTTQRPKREVADLLLELGFSASMVQDAADMMACPHLEARDMFVDLDYPATTGSFKAPSTPLKLSASQPMPVQRPPTLGEHTDDVLQHLLGLSKEDINALRQQGAI